jgi:hypothetical protein
MKGGHAAVITSGSALSFTGIFLTERDSNGSLTVWIAEEWQAMTV